MALLIIIFLWKNLALLGRHWVTTAAEVILPLGLTLLCVGLLLFFPSYVQRESKGGPPQDMFMTCPVNLSGFAPTIYFCPNTGFAADMRAKFEEQLTTWGVKGIAIQEAKDEDILKTLFTSLTSKEREKFMAVVFTIAGQGAPDDLEYKIRVQHFSPLEECLQILVDFAYTTLVTPSNSTAELTFDDFSKNKTSYMLEKMPVPEMKYELAAQTFVGRKQLGSRFLLVYTIIMTLIAYAILEEKCSGVTELMKIMGMKRWMVWVSWFLRVLMVHLFLPALVVILLTAKITTDGAIFPFTDAFIFYLLILLYVASVTCFMFAITAMFYRVLWGVLAVLFLSFATYMPLDFANVTSPTIQWAVMLLPNAAFFWGCNIITIMEYQGIGISWSRVSVIPGVTSRGTVHVSMIGVLVMLIVDMVLYSLLTYYIDAVREGTFGISEPLYYPVNKLMQLRKNKVGSDTTAGDTSGGRPSNYEQPSKNDQPGISIQNLRKVYPVGKTLAVDGVNIDFYKGQITALLGHNGAGKTTTMSIISGMSPPTNGAVLVNGFNIQTDLEKVRKGMGLCMQVDITYRNLTVMQNLTFVGLMKGRPWKVVRAEATELLKRLDLEDKKNAYPKELSGGQKRKMCMCVALIAGTQVVILDEPTSGMDPESRRVVWDMLLEMRGERTILITTHYMEEADALGDKIAIMDHGKVVCYGTSLYLKNKFGGGYKLSMIIQSKASVNKITKLVEGSVPGSELKGNVGAQLSYQLPASKKGNFSNLLESLQNRKEELGITSIGVSAASMDDVFLAVGRQETDPSKEARRSRSLSERSLRGRITGSKLIWQQFLALTHKKLIYMRRRWVFTLIMALLPILLCILAFIGDIFLTGEYTHERKSYTIGSTDSLSPQVMYSAGSDARSTSLARRYMAVVESQGGDPLDLSDKKDFRDAMLEEAYKNPRSYMSSVIAAAEFNVPPGGVAGRITALSCASEDLSIPVRAIAINLMNNAILRYSARSDKYSISSGRQEMTESMFLTILAAFFVIVIIGVAICVGSFMWLPLLERASCSKQIQLMTGTSVAIYWLPIILLDFLLYLVVLVVLLIVVASLDLHKLYSGSTEIGVFAVVLFVYGLAQMPIVYLFSFFANRPAKSFTIYIVVHILLTFVGFVYVSCGKWRIVLNFIPQIGLMVCFMTFFNIISSNKTCTSIDAELLAQLCAAPGSSDFFCCETDQGYMKDDEDKGIRQHLLRMLYSAIIYWVILVVVETGVFSMLNCAPSPRKKSEEDEDVVKERERIEEVETNGGEDILIANNLSKTYNGCRVSHAVKGVTLGVMPGECFGLLGTNGAGKTTTFKMLTGGVRPTQGTARINQFSLNNKRTQYLMQIGYCPQENAFLDELTAREMLVTIAQLRGIPRNKTDQHVDTWVQRVGLSEYERKPCGTYSGGNKRKLCTAMALIGDPPVVFLDEPTSGIDPAARRVMWGILTRVQKGNMCIILTSHSMDECEALCNRLSIQVKGELKCIGSIPYLKEKFGLGNTIIMKLKDSKGGNSDIQKMKRAFVEMFAPCELKDEHSVLLQYQLVNPRATSELFKSMESLKDRFANLIDDYSISETSLEEIFLSFAKASKKTQDK